MEDEDEIRAQVLNEMANIRQRITELERISEAKRRRAKRYWAEMRVLLVDTAGASQDRELKQRR